jgi:structural maintenance of chromosome 2
MRPPEILSLVEEAAGTRMWEDRKDKAVRTVAKKEKKVGEIESLLSEEITPKLDALRAEKKAWLAYQRAEAELQVLGRTLRAWEWVEAGRRVEAKAQEMEAVQAKIASAQEEQEELRGGITQAERESERITKARDKELKKGGRYQKLEAEVSELGKELERVKTRVELKEKSCDDEKKRKDKLAQDAKAVCFFSLF